MSNRLIGRCYSCQEDVLEEEYVLYDDKPFHKRCIKRYSGRDDLDE